MSLTICTMPKCQTTAGCVCHLEPKASGHTNCWCDPNVVRCGAWDCPRASRETEKREKRERLKDLMEGFKPKHRHPETPW